MKDIAIRVENLGKQYRLGQSERYHTLRDTIARAVQAPLRWWKKSDALKNDDATFWALRDVSFDVPRGEVVGIIGRNGAGKSTLLKVLSQITEPTEGKVELHGRVGSLLEVGTGFHPELTGRENVYLNGAILGMKRAEIASKFDEIVSFAEVERFIDTPVKHYSSGMYMRLAFAVAAHLEPEILVVDEVLAVGDTEFQKKCLGKMGDAARGGRTVLFVSHNMQAVRQLCRTGIVLKEGRVLLEGPIDRCLSFYLASAGPVGSSVWERSTLANPETPLAICRVVAELTGRQPDHHLQLTMNLRSCRSHKPAFLAVDFVDSGGAVFMQAIPTCVPFLHDNPAERTVTVNVELPPLVPGVYGVSIWIGAHNTITYDVARGCVSFQIDDSPTPDRSFPHHAGVGLIVPKSAVIENVAAAECAKDATRT